MATKRISQAELIASTLGQDVADVRDDQYQATRYSAPSVYAIGDQYYAAHPTKPRHEVAGEWRLHNDQFWCERYGTDKRVWVCDVEYEEKNIKEVAATKKYPAVLLYRVCWSCASMGNRQQWFATKPGAEKFAATLYAAKEAIEEVQIPKNKATLAEWLNHNFSTDNG
jgi:hypothetical protein